MNPLTLDLDHHFGKAEPIQPVQLKIAGRIVGGLLIIRGEREFQIACSLFPTAPREQLLPALEKSETT